MQPQSLDGHMGREIEIDLCVPCQSIWFDARENLQLTPGATLGVFRVIGERVSRPALQDRDIAKCPRCRAQLRRTQDMQRNTLRVFPLPERARPADDVFRFPEGEGLRQAAHAAAGRRAPQERPEHQLFELRRAGGPCEGLGLLALRVGALDARHPSSGPVDRSAA